MIVKSETKFRTILANVIASVTNTAVNQINYVRAVTSKMSGVYFNFCSKRNENSSGDNVLTDLAS